MLDHVLSFLTAWWPFWLLVYLPDVFGLANSLWANLMRSRLDHSYPDDLPMTAGDWLRMTLERNGLGHIKVVATTSNILHQEEFYYPRQKLIHLSGATYFKRDPVFWATAAHEMGHAVLYARRPVLTWFYMVARWLQRALARIGLGLAVGNVLYGMPEVTALAFYCLATAVALHVLVLIEEASASLVADRLLRRDGTLTPHQLAGARQHLLVCFSTYVMGLICHLILLLQWPRLVELIDSGRFDAAAGPLEGWRFVVVLLVSVVLVIEAAVVLRRAILPVRGLRGPDGKWTDSAAGKDLVPDFVVAICVFSLVYLLWDQTTDTFFWWCVLLACIPALQSILFVLVLPLIALYIAIRIFIHGKLLARYGDIQHTPEYSQAVKGGLRDLRDGDRHMDELREDERVQPSWNVRLDALVGVLFLPLLAASWLLLP